MAAVRFSLASPTFAGSPWLVIIAYPAKTIRTKPIITANGKTKSNILVIKLLIKLILSLL